MSEQKVIDAVLDEMTVYYEKVKNDATAAYAHLRELEGRLETATRSLAFMSKEAKRVHDVYAASCATLMKASKARNEATDEKTREQLEAAVKNAKAAMEVARDDMTASTSIADIFLQDQKNYSTELEKFRPYLAGIVATADQCEKRVQDQKAVLRLLPLSEAADVTNDHTVLVPTSLFFSVLKALKL
ncbi:Hypothetical protein POVN_LOCUS630 [uncultured virus]|nr:Hypothetical protein POVN_LOCUS630 [uncultured virus]